MNRTVALERALAEVYSGAGRLEAEAVLDHLMDQGFEVTQMAAARRAMKQRAELPFVSTRGLPKRRSSG